MLMSFTDWLQIRESSPLTRKRSEVAKGLQPPMADYMSRSTPPPGEIKSLEKKFKKSKAKTKKKKEDRAGSS